MPIDPRSVKLTSAQSERFTLRDAAGAPVPSPITWTLSAATGVGSVDGGGAYTYTAPGTIGAVVDVVLTATRAGGTPENAIIQLVPPEVILTPTNVGLQANEIQRFNVIVPGDRNNAVTWTIAPGSGTLDADGTYTAPDLIADDCEVMITARSTVDPHQSATATVRLFSQPQFLWAWAIPLCGYLVAVFCLVFLLMNLWPPTIGDITDLNRVRNALVAAQSASTRTRAAEDKAKAEQISAQTAVSNAPNDESKRKALATANAALQTATADRVQADKDLTDALKQEKPQEDRLRNAENQRVWVPFGRSSREVNLIWLVLVTGALGSFVYSARSFVAFVGNRTLRISWSAWYLLYPFIGAALALIFYLVIRGGFLNAATTGSEVNLYGLVAISGLVGMFSKQATTKLDELFSVMFKTDKDDKGLKDKLR